MHHTQPCVLEETRCAQARSVHGNHVALAGVLLPYLACAEWWWFPELCPMCLPQDGLLLLGLPAAALPEPDETLRHPL